MSPPRIAPVVGLTTVVVVGFYDLLLLWPATLWLEVNAFRDFFAALPGPTQFVVDTHWYLLAIVGLTHGGAAWAAHSRFGVRACVAAVLLSAFITAFWVWAMHLPFFSIAGAIK